MTSYYRSQGLIPVIVMMLCTTLSTRAPAQARTSRSSPGTTVRPGATGAPPASSCDSVLWPCAVRDRTTNTVIVDVSSGKPVILGNSHFPRTAKVRIWFVNLNPFRYDYSFSKKESVDAPSEQESGLLLTIAGIVMGTSKGALAEAAQGTTLDLAHSAAFRSGSDTMGVMKPSRQNWTPEDTAPCIDSLPMLQWARAIRSIDRNREILARRLRMYLGADSESVAMLRRERDILHSASTRSIDLQRAAGRLEALQGEHAGNVRKWLDDLAGTTEMEAVADTLLRELRALNRARLEKCGVTNRVADITERLDHIIENDVPVLLEGRRSLEASNAMWQREADVVAMRGDAPGSYARHDITAGPFDANTTVTIAMRRVDLDAVAAVKAEGEQSDDDGSGSDVSSIATETGQNIHFATRSRWTLAVGPTFANMDDAKFGRVSGFADGSSHGTADTVKSIISQTESASYRVGPALFIHYRIVDARLRGLPVGLLLSMGVGAAVNGASPQFSYMPALSLSLDDAWTLSFGAYFARVTKLAGNLRVGEEVPVGLDGDLPTRSVTRSAFGIAWTYLLE